MPAHGLKQKLATNSPNLTKHPAGPAFRCYSRNLVIWGISPPAVCDAVCITDGLIHGLEGRTRIL